MAINASNALNRLEPVYYRVTVANFDIDPVKPELFSGGLPTTKAASLLIEQANMRWEAVVRGASQITSPLFTPSFSSPGRTVDIPENDLVFTLTYDRPEFLDTEDETAIPARLTGAAAVKRFIARALLNDETLNRNFFDPTLSLGAIRDGSQVLEITALAAAANLTAAEAGLTVVEITNLDDKP